MELILNNNLFQDGQRISQENPTLKEVVEFMEHPVSRGFYDKWIKSPELENGLFFLWTYEQLEKSYPELLPIERLALLSHLTRNSNYSTKLIESYKNQPLRLTAVPSDAKHLK